MTERTIKLNPEQFKIIRKAYRELKAIDDTTSTIIKTLIAEKVEQEEEFWEQIYSIAGLSVGEASIDIRWVSQELCIKEGMQ